MPSIVPNLAHQLAMVIYSGENTQTEQNSSQNPALTSNSDVAQEQNPPVTLPRKVPNDLFGAEIRLKKSKPNVSAEVYHNEQLDILVHHGGIEHFNRIQKMAGKSSNTITDPSAAIQSEVVTGSKHWLLENQS